MRIVGSKLLSVGFALILAAIVIAPNAYGVVTANLQGVLKSLLT